MRSVPEPDWSNEEDVELYAAELDARSILGTRRIVVPNELIPGEFRIKIVGDSFRWNL